MIIIFKVAVYAYEESTMTGEEPLGRARRITLASHTGQGKCLWPPDRLQSRAVVMRSLASEEGHN